MLDTKRSKIKVNRTFKLYPVKNIDSREKHSETNNTQQDNWTDKALKDETLPISSETRFRLETLSNMFSYKTAKEIVDFCLLPVSNQAFIIKDIDIISENDTVTEICDLLIEKLNSHTKYLEVKEDNKSNWIDKLDRVLIHFNLQ